MIPPNAVEIQVSQAMAGSKQAIQFGDGPIIVSPAMHELMKNADPDELQRLLKSIPILHLPAMPDYTREPLPMTFGPPPMPESFDTWLLREMYLR